MIATAKEKIDGLFGASLTPQQRGQKLEGALHGLFEAYGILVHESFHLVGDDGEGTVEPFAGDRLRA